jgi:hypothetical protein
MRVTSVALLLLFACHESAARPEHAEAAPPPTAAPSAASAGNSSPARSSAGGVIIRDSSGTELVNIQDSGGVVNISYTADGQRHTLRGTAKESGKRKYSTDNGPVMFEVKPGDSGFKLRTADGTLRWKVKVAKDKIKISDNEENNNPFELKVREDGVKVVAPGERELGKVKRDSSKGDIVVEDASGAKSFRIDGPATPAYGVMLLDSIPPPQKYMLIAELMAGER